MSDFASYRGFDVNIQQRHGRYQAMVYGKLCVGGTYGECVLAVKFHIDTLLYVPSKPLDLESLAITL